MTPSAAEPGGAPDTGRPSRITTGLWARLFLGLLSVSSPAVRKRLWLDENTWLRIGITNVAHINRVEITGHSSSRLGQQN